MSKFGLFASIMSIAGVLTFATFAASADDAKGPGAGSAPAPSPAAGVAPCVHTDFKTELVKKACEKGGQPEAKAVMKTFMKDAKIKTCNECHAKLAPKYDLKPKALEQFQKAGGK